MNEGSRFFAVLRMTKFIYMKKLLRNTTVNSLALYILPSLVTSFELRGGFLMYIMAGLVFSLLSFIVKPILKILTIPLNFITFGLFSFVSGAILLYLLTIFVPQITITEFNFTGFEFLGFVVPRIHFNLLFTYIVCSFFISLMTSGIEWVFDK